MIFYVYFSRTTFFLSCNNILVSFIALKISLNKLTPLAYDAWGFHYSEGPDVDLSLCAIYA
jgi:hypothetical protein